MKSIDDLKTMSTERDCHNDIDVAHCKLRCARSHAQTALAAYVGESGYNPRYSF
jgi:hypothetical protein